MNLQNLIIIVLRLLALDFLLRSLIQVFPNIALSRAETALPWLIMGGLVVGAALLWVMASPIARLVTRGIPVEITFGSMSLADCYTIAFIGTGLYYFASHFPQTLNWSHYLFKAAASSSGSSWKEGVDFYQVSHAFVPFIVGIILFVNGRTWALALARKQNAGAGSSNG